jgi:hypothetical protein
VKKNALLVGLACLAAVAVGGLVLLFVTADAEQKRALRFEFAKGAIQLVVVVILGAALKLLTDRYQQRALQSEEQRQFRQDKYDRIVDATNQLRKVPILIEGNRSAKTWSEQMLSILDAGLSLRTLKHQFYASGALDYRPFPNHKELVLLVELMYHYTDWVADDFPRMKKNLGEAQRQAEAANLPAQERSRLQMEVWDRIQTLRWSDMQQTAPASARQDCREKIEELLKQPPPDSGASEARWKEFESWVAYQEAESLALEAIVKASLGMGTTGK